MTSACARFLIGQSLDDVSTFRPSRWPALVAWCWLNNRRPLPAVSDRRNRLVQVTAKTEYHNNTTLHCITLHCITFTFIYTTVSMEASLWRRILSWKWSDSQKSKMFSLNKRKPSKIQEGEWKRSRLGACCDIIWLFRDAEKAELQGGGAAPLFLRG